MTGVRRPGRRISRPAFAALTGAIVAIMATACGSGTHPAAAKPEVSGPLHGWTPPQPEPLSPLADYQAAVQVAVANHLKVWIETDLVKRWQEGPDWFHDAVRRVAVLANQPGVVGIKIADEIGYNDGMNSVSKISKFLSAAAQALHAAAPGKLILVDMVVPQLGCLPGHQGIGSPAAACASREQAAYPQLALPEVDRYLRMHAIDVLDLSTYLLSDDTYKAWGTTADAAQTAAWQEVDKRGWPGLVRLQARKALAHPGAYRGTSADSAADLQTYVDIPLAAQRPCRRHLDLEPALRRPGVPPAEPRDAAERPVDQARAVAASGRRAVHALQSAFGHIWGAERPGDDRDRLH